MVEVVLERAALEAQLMRRGVVLVLVLAGSECCARAF